MIDPRLSNTSAKANLWLPAYSGTEGALLLAMVNVLLDEELYDREFVRNWVNWRDVPARAIGRISPSTFESFIAALKELYAQFTPEFAADETGVAAAQIVEAARAIGRARQPFSTHNWRSAAAGNLWGWQITRCLYLLVVLTGSVGDEGRRRPAPLEQVRAEASEPAAAARRTGTSCCSRASIRSPSSR